jgi:hypothetical protein
MPCNYNSILHPQVGPTDSLINKGPAFKIAEDIVIFPDG